MVLATVSRRCGGNVTAAIQQQPQPSRSSSSLPILVDGNCFAHRWYHRWEFARKSVPEGAEAPNPAAFAVNNARSLVALAHAFRMEHLQAQEMPSATQMLKFSDLDDVTRRNKLLFCFDHGDAGRATKFPEYKRERKIRAQLRPLEFDIFFSQAVRVFQSQPANTCIVVPHDLPRATQLSIDAEADDMIATVSKELSQRNIPHVVMSHDFDLWYLVRDDIPVAAYDPNKKALLGEAGVTARTKGTPPRLLVDFKLLSGDRSDCVPGVKKIGERRAQKILDKYGSLQEALRLGPTDKTLPKVMRDALANAEADLRRTSDVLLHQNCDWLTSRALAFFEVKP